MAQLAAKPQPPGPIDFDVLVERATRPLPRRLPDPPPLPRAPPCRPHRSPPRNRPCHHGCHLPILPAHLSYAEQRHPHPI
jgi:hypothetical protein